MAKNYHALTEGEWIIIQTVWELEPCAAPTVQEALQRRKNWAYSTVKTMMDRMVDKGLLETERIRNLMLYSSAITRSQAQKGEVMRMLKRAFDGALTPMLQFLIENQQLSEEELQGLEDLIKKRRDKEKSS